MTDKNLSKPELPCHSPRHSHRLVDRATASGLVGPFSDRAPLGFKVYASTILARLGTYRPPRAFTSIHLKRDVDRDGVAAAGLETAQALCERAVRAANELLRQPAALVRSNGERPGGT